MVFFLCFWFCFCYLLFFSCLLSFLGFFSSSSISASNKRKRRTYIYFRKRKRSNSRNVVNTPVRFLINLWFLSSHSTLQKETSKKKKKKKKKKQNMQIELIHDLLFRLESAYVLFTLTTFPAYFISYTNEFTKVTKKSKWGKLTCTYKHKIREGTYTHTYPTTPAGIYIYIYIYMYVCVCVCVCVCAKMNRSFRNVFL